MITSSSGSLPARILYFSDSDSTHTFFLSLLLDGHEDVTHANRTGAVESLNVSVAAGILLHALMNSSAK